MRVALLTHGCRCNQAETDALAQQLVAHGHRIVDTPQEAEAAVLNSCTITAAADADARRRLRTLRRDFPGLRLVATGCWATAQPAEAERLADLVVGNDDKDALPLRLEQTAAFVPASALVRRAPGRLVAAPPVVRARALLKIQDGCNYRCAFCIVPSVRGASRSVPLSEVARQLEGLVAAGVPEVVLTGIHLGTWGRDLRPRLSLCSLVEALLPRLGPARLRLSSIDPHEVDDALLDLFVAHPDRLCRHLHLPVQSVDEGVLRRMRRGHDAAAFIDVVQRATARVPGLAIGTDVIVGFPGEDEAAFERTRARLSSLPMAYLHVFPYSERQGTAAAMMAGAIPRAVRAARCRTLRAVSDRAAADFRRALAGTPADVVVHRRPDAAGRRIGLTDNYVRLVLPDTVRPGARLAVLVDAEGRGALPALPS